MPSFGSLEDTLKGCRSAGIMPAPAAEILRGGRSGSDLAGDRDVSLLELVASSREARSAQNSRLKSANSQPRAAKQPETGFLKLRVLDLYMYRRSHFRKLFLATCQGILASGSCKWFLQVVPAPGSCKWFRQVVPASGCRGRFLQVVPASGSC